MKPPVRIAVNIQPVQDASGNASFKAALPMGVLFEKSLDAMHVERARADLEQKYSALVETLRGMRPHLKDGNILRYWMFGDLVIAFENETANALVFVDKLSDHLARDVEYSKTM